MSVSLDSVGSFILVLGLATVFLLVLLLRQQRTKKEIAIWAISGATGLLLGAALVTAAVLGMGYELVQKSGELPVAMQSPGGGASPGMPGSPGSGGMAGPGAGLSGPGGGMGAPGGGMMGMMGGGGRGPSPKRQLTTLVRKLELLTGDIAIALTTEQSSALRELLTDVSTREKLTDDEAKELHDKLLDLLDETQRAKQEAIGLPFRRTGGGGPGGGFGGGGFGGGAAPDPDANPFQEDENAQATQKLSDRLKPVSDK